MPTLGGAIYSRLTAAQTGDDATRTAALAVLAASIGTRVFPAVSQGNVYPLVVYQVHRETDDAINARTAREFTVTFTIEAKGDGAYLAASTIAANIRILLDRRYSEDGGAGVTWPASGGAVVRFFFTDSDEDVFADGGNHDALYFERDEVYEAHANCET